MNDQASGQLRLCDQAYRPRFRLLGCCFMGCLLTTMTACQPPERTAQPPADSRGIFGKTTQDVGEFEPQAQSAVSDGRIDERQLATPGIGALAAYGPAVEKLMKLQIQQAVQLFQAANDRYPKDHAEFMAKIIKANQIQLPVLPGGRQYQYDVDNHTLVVVEGGSAEAPRVTDGRKITATFLNQWRYRLVSVRVSVGPIRNRRTRPLRPTPLST